MRAIEMLEAEMRDRLKAKDDEIAHYVILLQECEKRNAALQERIMELEMKRD